MLYFKFEMKYFIEKGSNQKFISLRVIYLVYMTRTEVNFSFFFRLVGF